MSPVAQARRIIAHELRRLASEIEAGAVSDAIFNDADDLIDAFRREPAPEVCDCCAADPGACDCEIGTHGGNDPETGPYSERGCKTHSCRV